MKHLFSLLVIFLFITITTYAQVPVKVISGQIIIDDGSMIPNAAKYAAVANTIDNRLKTNPSDTTSLFFRAMLYVQFNDLMAKPFAGDTTALKNLVIAKNMIEKAIILKMTDLKLRVLRAQVYKELCYRFSSDESWKFNAKQIAKRRILFNNYKDLANGYYDELAVLDKHNAYDYQRMKVKEKYPL